MVLELLQNFDEYEIENIPRSNNRYIDVMANATSLAPIKIEDEEIVLEIKNLNKASNLTLIVRDLCANYYFKSHNNSYSYWYYSMYEYDTLL